MNDCHARMSATRCVFNMTHVWDSRMSFGRGVEMQVLPRVLLVEYPNIYCFEPMWHIYDCLYRDRWASHRLGSVVKRNVCEVVATSDARLQPIGS